MSESHVAGIKEVICSKEDECNNLFIVMTYCGTDLKKLLDNSEKGLQLPDMVAKKIIY